MPDAVLASADDVVLIDITPDSLIERLLAGKVYPQERVQTALNNFFKVENLSALREVALRQVAEEVEHKRNPDNGPHSPGARPRGREERLVDGSAPSAIGERLLALVTPEPSSQRIVRRAWRSAQRLGAELDVLWVASEDEPTEEENEQLAALRRLASVLGAHLLVERGPDVAQVTQRVARERGTTYVLMGAPSPQGALRRLMAPGLPARLMTLLPGVDLRIVADRTPRREGGRVTAVLIVIIVVLVVALAAAARRAVPAPWAPPQGPARAPSRRSGGSCSRSWGRRCPSARSTRRCAWPAPRAPPWCRSSWPASRSPCRSTRRCPARRPSASRFRRRSSSARRRSASPWMPASSAGAPTATPCARRSPPSASSGSSWPPPATAGPGFGPDDVAWLLATAPGEIVVLRPGAEDQLVPSPPRPRPVPAPSPVAVDVRRYPAKTPTEPTTTSVV